MVFGKNSADQAKRKMQHEEQKKQIRERLLATLPLVPEVVNKGDSGDMSLLDNRDHPVTQAFNNLVNEITVLNAPGTIRLVKPAA